MCVGNTVSLFCLNMWIVLIKLVVSFQTGLKVNIYIYNILYSAMYYD